MAVTALDFFSPFGHDDVDTIAIVFVSVPAELCRLDVMSSLSSECLFS